MEKTGKFCKVKDCFGLWDLIGISPGHTKFVQVKSNSKPNFAPFKKFAERYPQLECEIWVFKDYQKAPDIYKI